MLDESETLPRRWRGYWKEGCIFLGITSFILLVALIAVSASRRPTTPPPDIHLEENLCDTTNEDIHHSASSDANPPVFNDLTEVELLDIRSYLLRQTDLNIVSVKKALVNSSYIYSCELLLPPKKTALRYMDNGGPRPKRWAKVVIFRGDLPNAEIQEYRVGPLPHPSNHELIEYGGKRKNPIPFAYRPLTLTDIGVINAFIFPELVDKMDNLLKESFGATLHNCSDKCLTYSAGPLSTSYSGEVVRRFWLRFSYAVEFITLHPVDFQILVNLDGVNTQDFKIEKLWYNQRLFDSVDIFVQAYKQGNVDKIHSTFPKVNNELFSTLNLRGKPFPSKPLRRPYLVEPDGRRYSVRGQHVQYMGWSFNYRLSISTGPMLLDIRYKMERIAYEVSLQEIAVFYSGYGPASRFSDIVDSASMLGVLSKILVPGADCPEHATFLPVTTLSEDSDSPVTYHNAMCLFEQETGNPLRRHHSFSAYSGQFYEGMLDDVLVLRTIVTVGNYDYIIDYVFHQNAALEVKVMATGYILASHYSDNEEKFGFEIHKGLLGNVHHHMFHFKADVDVLGTSNRFESVDIGVDETPNSEWSEARASVYNQLKITRNLRTTELNATYKFDFNKPKYLLFYNNKEKSKEGLSRAYRISIDGMSKMLLPEDMGAEPSISWARYQMAVTKQKQSELQSSSIYAIWDAVDSVNNFQSFIDDDENIVDEDLVAWISMGVHHIPHTEDLPLTPTPGGHLQFFLLPYNYFREDPAMSSRNAIRYDLGGKDSNGKPKLRISRYGVKSGKVCVPKLSKFDELLQKNTSLIFA